MSRLVPHPEELAELEAALRLLKLENEPLLWAEAARKVQDELRQMAAPSDFWTEVGRVVDVAARRAEADRSLAELGQRRRTLTVHLQERRAALVVAAERVLALAALGGPQPR